MSDPKNLDLDALQPPEAIIKFNNQDIVVQPPKTADLLRLGSLGGKMENIQDLTGEEVDKLVADLTALIGRVIPELQNQSLNVTQLLALIQLIGEMSTPPETKELNEKGITSAGNSDPKA